jgi:hypothetical protein
MSPKLTINMAMRAMAAKLFHHPAHAQISTIQQTHAGLGDFRWRVRSLGTVAAACDREVPGLEALRLDHPHDHALCKPEGRGDL